MRPGIAVVLSLAIIVLTSHAPAAQSGALLQNGSFDVTQNGRPIGWLVDGGSFESVSEPVAEPGLAARLAPLGAALSARAVQNVTLQPGGAYRLSAKVLVNDSDVQFVRLDITWDGDSASSKPFSAIGPNYVTLQASQLTLSCDAHDVQVALVLRRSSTTQAAAVFIDDVVLESVGQVPCPTATPPPTLPPGQPPSASATPQPDETAAAGIGPLRNSGFEQVEDGALVAWRDHGGALTRVANPVHGGSFAGAFFSSSESTKWAYQSVAVTPQSWYEFAAYIYASDPDLEAALLRVSWYTSADSSGSAIDSVDSSGTLETASSAYRRLSTGSIQAPPGARSANVRILLRPRSSAGAIIYIDDASWRPAAAAPGSAEEDGGSIASDYGGRGGSSSSVRGVSRGPVNALGTPFPTPVLVRGDEALAGASSGNGGMSRWWIWAAVGAGAAIAGGAGWWRWTRQ